MALALKDKSLGTTLATIDDDEEVVVEDTEEPEEKKVTGTDKNTKTTATGYVATSDLITYAHETVDIPKAFNGLEAVAVPTRLRYQYFEIESVSEEDDGVTIVATHVFYQLLQNQTYWMWEERDSEKYVEYDVSSIINNIMARKMSTDDRFSFSTDSTDTEYGYNLDYGNKNIVETLLDPETGICKRFGLSLIRDNWFVYLIKDEHVGTDRGFVIERGKNLLGVTREESIENTITRVAPIGRDLDGNIVWLSGDEWWVDSANVGEYSVPRCELLDTGIQITSESDAEQLRREGREDEIVDWGNIMEKLWYAARDRFTKDHIDLPEVEMTVDFVSLGDTEEYRQYRDLDKVYLYDRITVNDPKRGYEYAAQVVGIEHDILTGMMLSVTIGSITNWDGVRKIATWQVPQINGANIRLQSIQSGAFASGAIATSIGPGGLSWVHIDALSTRTLTTDQLTALQASIHELIAGTITAQDITAHSITSDLIQAGAITTDLLAADSVTAEKIKSGAITADMITSGIINAGTISAETLAAVHAKLKTADIADAQIGNADIDYAQIKDLHAGSAYLDQAVFRESVGGKLFVDRLAIGYGQMVSATIGDLVLKGSDGNYYQVDVGLNGNVTGTLIPEPSAEEKAAGHTNAGRTIVETELTAQEINTSNIYATHALMDEITAAIINVDALFAREATIAKINAMDITSNTYLRAVIGDWDKGSTILQTIDSLDSRVSGLGHGQIYYSTTEPSHSNLLPGDIWILPEADLTWSDVSNFTWGDATEVPWTEIAGLYKMYSWTGRMWRLLYDSNISVNLSTQIQQNREQIALKANSTTVNTLSGQVSDFAGTLEVQSREIRAAVESLEAVTNTYVSWADPRNVHEVGLGDIWVKIPSDGFHTWGTLYNSEMTWQDLADAHKWKESLGGETYVWNGAEWLMTADRASEVHYQTVIEETDRHVRIMAQEQATIANQVYRNTATLLITAEQIKQEVERAIAAEATRIEKTTRLQTADAIVEEAVRQSLDSTGNAYIAKTTRLQTADQIVNEAVRQSNSQAEGAYIAKTTNLQTADQILLAAEQYTSLNAYKIQSGIDIKAAGIEISGAKYIKILSGGSFEVASGNFNVDNNGGKIGGWNFSPSWMWTGSGVNCVTLVGAERGSDVSVANWNRVKDYAMYAGAGWADEAPFRVKRDGTVYVSKLIAQDGDGADQTLNLRTLGLWKLGYHTIKSYSDTSLTLSNGDTINFSHAVDRLTLSGDPAATATTLAINVWYSSDYYVTALLDITAWKEKVQEATYWDIYRTAGGDTVTVVVGGKTHTHFFAA